MKTPHTNGNGSPADPLGAVRSLLTAALEIGDRAATTNDQHGCYELYACTARLVLHSLKGADHARRRLQEALHQCAVLADPGQQARVLRRVFDELAPGAAGAAADPETDTPREPLQEMRSFIATAIHIGAPAYNSGDHRGCYEVYACTARMLLQTVDGADDAKQLLRKALEKCATLDDPDKQAWAMRHAFDAICGTPTNALEAIHGYLAMAIQIGAPAYNYGDHRGCYEVYACTARLMLSAIEGAEDAKQVLRRALERCRAVKDVKQQAWIMREAFDELLGDAPGAAPG
jgi:hypothetical protein